MEGLKHEPDRTAVSDGWMDVWRNTRRLDRLVTRYVAILLTVLVVLLGSFTTLTYVDGPLRAADQNRFDAQRLLQLVIDEETGVRGYGATRDRELLRPYTSAEEQIQPLIASLRIRFSTMPDAAAAFEHFVETHRHWQDRIAAPILTRPAAGENTQLQRVGKTLMDSQRIDIATIQAIFLDEYDRISSLKALIRYVSMGIALAAIVMIAIAGYVSERRSIAREKTLLESLINERDAETLRGQWRTKLVAMLAHDFRSSLAVILGFSEMLEAFPEKRNDHAPYEGIRRAVSDLTLMSEEALLMARVASNAFSVVRVPVNLRVVIDEVVLRYARERAIVVEADHERVLAEERYLLRVLDNLISNAIKYSPAGSEIRVSVRPVRAGIELAVTDNGQGIDADDLPHVFDEFWRAKNAGERSGTGIGLYIVKKIVDALGGSVTIESRLGKGTTVRVVLPSAPAAATPIAG